MTVTADTGTTTGAFGGHRHPGWGVGDRSVAVVPEAGTLCGVVERLGVQASPGRRTIAELDHDFDAFVTARATGLLRFAAVMVKNPHDAEDVLQDVLVKAHLNWASICRAGNPDAYVRKMVVNAATSFWRRAVRIDRVVDAVGRDPGASAVVGDVAGGLADRDHLLQLLRQVPARQRAVLVMRHYEGMDDAVIAEVLGITQVAVRSNASRGLARLRELLGEAEGGDVR